VASRRMPASSEQGHPDGGVIIVPFASMNGHLALVGRAAASESELRPQLIDLVKAQVRQLDHALHL